ncbi:MAG: diphosphate--fructose-6-phosphate 1-phosphotransferase [Oscillospiraceae bacterium]|nr:diphosphate--fructose-6-phosphate 1-phosphotransferase [Oscillospiraceae bacterium]
MAQLKGNMLIAHGGGPTPVINSSLRGAIEAAREVGEIETIYGARFGVEGVLGDELIDLALWNATDLERLSFTPASAIGSCRRKLGDSDYPRVLACFEKFNIRYFFYNGGNDSMDTCYKIHKLAQAAGYDLRVIGIPKTIDNDLAETDHSPGYGSAARYAAMSAAELAMDAAALPIHVVVLEAMGRNAGWITAAAALFADKMPCNHLVYLPELVFDRARFLADVQEAFDRRRGLLVTVSEGIKDANGKLIGDTGIKDGFGHPIAGGAAQSLASLILAETDLKARAEKPGLLGRVSIAHQSPIDRDEAYQVGAFAVKSAVGGESGFMVSIQAQRTPAYHSEMRLVPLEKVANAEKCFPLEWINEGGNGIKSAFRDYCLPLIGANCPDFISLPTQV